MGPWKRIKWLEIIFQLLPIYMVFLSISMHFLKTGLLPSGWSVVAQAAGSWEDWLWARHCYLSRSFDQAAFPRPATPWFAKHVSFSLFFAVFTCVHLREEAFWKGFSCVFDASWANPVKGNEDELGFAKNVLFNLFFWPYEKDPVTRMENAFWESAWCLCFASYILPLFGMITSQKTLFGTAASQSQTAAVSFQRLPWPVGEVGGLGLCCHVPLVGLDEPPSWCRSRGCLELKRWRSLSFSEIYGCGPLGQNL